jgi:hypothetical protein
MLVEIQQISLSNNILSRYGGSRQPRHFKVLKDGKEGKKKKFKEKKLTAYIASVGKISC